MRRRLLVTRRLPDTVEARLDRDYDVTCNLDDTPPTRAWLEAAMREQDALCVTLGDRIDASLLALPDRRVGMMANFGAGTDHIDLGAARTAGITVSNTPDALTDATAEVALLLMLMTARRAGEGERELRAGRWSGWRPTHMVGQGLGGKTLGLVGFGRIAQATARRARSFGMTILYHSRNPGDPAAERELDARRMPSLMALAAAADVLSLHVPGGAGTRHMVDAGLLAEMRPTAILVNTARGSVIDEPALVAALTDRRIAAAGLDVYDGEPAIAPALLACPNTVLLPHLGSATAEARTAMGMQVADCLDAFFAGSDVPNRVA